jgi:hypothetical protein
MDEVKNLVQALVLKSMETQVSLDFTELRGMEAQRLIAQTILKLGGEPPVSVEAYDRFIQRAQEELDESRRMLAHMESVAAEAAGGQ